MNFKIWFLGAIIAVFSTSCVSSYRVSNNAYQPQPGEQSHFTVEGVKIPKASLKYSNQFEVDPDIEPLKLDNPDLASLDIKKDLNVSNHAIPYKAYSVIEEAKTYLGTPYRYGGTTRRGIDCSAFTQRVFGANNIDLPRVARSQAGEGTYIDKSQVQKGDLLFFITRGSYISHVGIVESVDHDGDIKFIHASSSQGVTISSLNSSYWSRRFKYAKRII